VGEEYRVITYTAKFKRGNDETVLEIHMSKLRDAVMLERFQIVAALTDRRLVEVKRGHHVLHPKPNVRRQKS
jgi:hypothetical protein